MPLDRGQIARPAPFVSDRPLRTYAQHERRIVVEEERGNVVVVDPQEDVRTLLGKPGG
jgi:hypothetical protein